MTYRSSIYTIPAGEEPAWAEGVPHYGWHTISGRPLPPDEVSDLERQVIHCAPGTEPPENVITVAVRGHVTPWTPEMVCAHWPTGHKYVMEAAWIIEGERIRGKIIDAPEGVELVETMLVPHEWLGDGKE